MQVQVQFVSRPPGASSDELRKVEAKFAVTLPAEFRQLLEDSDGPILWFGFKELQFFSCADILADFQQVQRYMPQAMPVCMDGCGNICVAKISAGRVHSYHVADCGNLAWEDAAEIAGDFNGFLHDAVAPETRL